MDTSATSEYLQGTGPLLPSVAAPITAEQRAYDPLVDHEAPDLELDTLLYRAGLGNYAGIIINDHGIETSSEFAELQESDTMLFCKLARDRILFRKLLRNMVSIFKQQASPTPPPEIPTLYRGL